MFLACSDFCFKTTQLLAAAAALAAATAAALRRSISAGVRGSWEVGGRVAESVAVAGAGAAGRAGIAARTLAVLGRTTAGAGLGTTSRRPRKAVEWAEGRD